MLISIMRTAFSAGVIACFMLATDAVRAFEMGPLSDVVEPRSDGDWTVVEEDGAAILENRNSAYAITYYFVAPKPGDEGRREISVDVGMLASESDSLAGLLYGFEQDPKSYFLFTVGGDRSINLHFFDRGNMQERMKLTPSGLEAEKTRLTIREAGNEIALIVNGVEMSTIGNDRIGRGAVGIVAGHIGRYSFRNFAVSVGTAATGSGPIRNTSKRREAPADALLVKRAEIVDTRAPFGPMPAGSTLIPADWRIESRIEWFPTTYCKRGPQLTWAALSPGDRYGVGTVSGLTWSVQEVPLSNYGCLTQDITDAEAAIRTFVSQVPDAEIMEVTRPPEIQPLVEAFRAMALSAPNMRSHVDGVLARARFTENGETSETAVLMITQHDTLSIADAYGNPRQNRSGRALFTMLFSAPLGKLDEGHPAFAMVMQNYQPNPEWDRRTSQWWAQQRGALQRPPPVGTSSDGGKSVGDILFEGYQKRAGMTDDGQRRSVEGIWNVNTYQTDSGTRTFSDQYDQVWQLDDGRYVLTNDAFFNPNQDIGVGGSQLERVR